MAENYELIDNKERHQYEFHVEKYTPRIEYIKVGSINSIFYFLHKAAEPFNCLEQDNLA